MNIIFLLLIPFSFIGIFSSKNLLNTLLLFKIFVITIIVNLVWAKMISIEYGILFLITVFFWFYAVIKKLSEKYLYSEEEIDRL